MADARAKAVLGVLSDIYSRGRFAIDAVTPLREPLGLGDIIEVPSIAALTVTASGATSTTPQAITTNILSLNANLDPMINCLLPRLAATQLMDGRWAEAVARQAMIMLKNDMDAAFLRTYLAQSIAWTTGTAATYHDNVAGDSLTSADWLNAKAGLLAQDGCQEQNIVAFISPYAEASIRSIAAFVPNFMEAEKGNIGIPMLGRVHGIPVYVTNSILRGLNIATTACSITTNVATATVAAGHGLVAGVPITSTGMTVNQSVATAITSTTATTIVYALTGADGAMADGVGTIIDASSWNVMMDIAQVFTAQQGGPMVRVVPDFQTTGDALQLSTIWGRIARAAYTRVIHSPGSSA